MTWRFGVFRWLQESPWAMPSCAALGLAALVAPGVVVGVMDAALDRPEMRRGLTVWTAFVVGFSGLVAFNTALHPLGLGYPGWGTGR